MACVTPQLSSATITAGLVLPITIARAHSGVSTPSCSVVRPPYPASNTGCVEVTSTLDTPTEISIAALTMYAVWKQTIPMINQEIDLNGCEVISAKA